MYVLFPVYVSTSDIAIACFDSGINGAILGYHYTKLLFVQLVLHDVIDIPSASTYSSALIGASVTFRLYCATI